LEPACGYEYGTRTLATWLYPTKDKSRPAFHMPTYDMISKDVNRYEQDIDFPEDDLYHSWIFIY